MKNLLFIIFGLIILTSCEKEEEFSEFKNGGVIDNATYNTNSNGYTDDLTGTQWLLTAVDRFGTSMEKRNDTITFIDNVTYTINTSTFVRSYQYASLPLTNAYALTLNDFTPFGSGHYTGEVSRYFIDDWSLNGIEFYDTQQTNPKKFWAWLERIY